MKKTFLYLDIPLLALSVLLFVIGAIMIFSASNVTAFMLHVVNPYHYFIRQVIFLLGGLVVSLFMIRFNTKVYGMFSWFLMISGGAVLFLLLIFGQIHNQAIRWIDLGLFSVQPSEFMKVITIIWLARYYEVHEKKVKKSWSANLFPLVICGVIAALIFASPDLGTTIIYVLIVGAIFLAVPISKMIKTKILFFLMGAFGIAMLMIMINGNVLLERQMDRLNFSNPCERLLTTGGQVCNGYIAINNGGLTGVGLGNSTQKYLYLSEPYTDFIFAIVVEELGLIVAIGIILLFMIVLYRILKIGRNSYTNRGAIMCYGVAVYIFSHIAVNLLGIFGVIPLTGAPLPFMSYGGSFAVSLIAALTIVQRVQIENKTRDMLKKGK